jgi:hypothetical protein
MSNETKKPENVSVITDVPAQGDSQTEAPKVGFFRRAGQYVSDHRRPALVVGALLGLTGLAYAAGKNSAQTPVYDVTLELDSPDEIVPELEVTDDTTVA